MSDDDDTNNKWVPKKPALAIVTTPDPNAPQVVAPELPISEIDIQDLNVDKLRETMVKNIYVVEAALFQQAGYEYKRIGSMRDLISKIEKELFDPAVLTTLSTDQKIKLYNNLASNMGKSLDFLGKLHDNVTSGLDTLGKIEKLKTQADTVKKTNEEPGGNTQLEDIKKMVLEKIKERVK